MAERAGMTASAYQIDKVIKAYHKQMKSRRPLNIRQKSSDGFADCISLSGEDARAAAYQKISYTLADILRHGKKPSEKTNPTFASKTGIHSSV